MPLSPAFRGGRDSPTKKRETAYWYEKGRVLLGTGFFTEIFTHVGQWGTHVDPPAHFIKGLRTVDQISPKEMILALVVIDVHSEVAKNPDYTLNIERIKKWEMDYGRVRLGAFVPRWRIRTRPAFRFTWAGVCRR